MRPADPTTRLAALHQRVAELPTQPGCYLFKDGKGRVLYVGKAANLRVRVRQYFAGTDERVMVPFLVRAASDVDVVVTRTEKEALLLENTLIKQHQPRYNVKLRDDSNFLHLRLDLREPWPRYRLVRRIADDGAKYFGPYHSASKARSTLAFLQRAFPLRTCTDAVLKSRTRPCLLHQMGRCVAPCVGLVDEAQYRDLAVASTDLLTGRSSEAIRNLRARMQAEAEALRFEHAARLRDLAANIQASLERQRVIDTKLGDRDIWGLHREGAQGVLAIVPIREGVMGEPRTTRLQALVGEDGDVLSSLLNAAYPEGVPIPAEVVLPVLPSDHEALADVLSDRRGARVTVVVPQRGDKVRLVDMAEENAKIRWHADTDEAQRHAAAMEALAELLGLPGPPHRMECFDNSHISGSDPVAAMAVFVDGRPERSLYRKYRIKTAMGGDDYASMREVLDRRFRRAIDEGDAPDLLVVDGGKGQVAVAVAVLEDLGLHDQPVVGIAKPRTEHARGDRHATDKIVLPGTKEPLRAGRGHPALRILQHLRDETHRAALRYQRQVRQKASLVSVLEGIPGVGKARRTALLKALGSAEAVALADPAALAAVPGIGPQLAAQIWGALHPEG